MKLPYILVLSLLVLFGCSKFDPSTSNTNEDGEIVYLTPLWEKSRVSSQNWLDTPLSIFGNWSFNNKVLSKYRRADNTIVLQCLDATTGELCWEWDEFFHPETEGTSGRFYFFRDNILHWKTGARQYWLDIESGTTVKKYYGDQYFTTRMQTLGDTYFCNGVEYNTYPGFQLFSVFQGDFYDEKPKKALTIDMDTTIHFSNRLGGITNAFPYIDGKDTLVAAIWFKLFPPGWNTQSYIGLYNLSKKEWIYNNVVLYDIHTWGEAIHVKKYKNTLIMNIHRKLICMDYTTGQKKWEREFRHDFRFSGFEISEDILVANCEDKTLYGIDPNSGRILWTGEGAGTSTNLHERIMNGVVYFAGGSSGYIHAVDIYNGKTLWKIDPYLYEKSNAFWLSYMNVVRGENGEKGKIVVKNALNTYCFDAVR